MKKALITGSSGFIGRHFTRYLTTRGWDVEECDVRIGRDALELFRYCDCPQFDLVIHGAYQVGGRMGIDGINDYFAQNLQLDAAMFRWAMRTRQKRVVYFSSSAAYPTFLQVAAPPSYLELDLRLDEDSIELDVPERADSYYGLAKITGENLSAVARSNGVAVTVVRPFSGYGEGQSMDYPFPSIINRALSGDYTVWGPQGQTRDWIHVRDVVEATMAIVESGTADPVNICSGTPVEMGELMRTILEVYASRGGVVPDVENLEIFYDTSAPTGVFYRVGNPTKMLTYHTPRIGLDEGISRTIDELFWL